MQKHATYQNSIDVGNGWQQWVPGVAFAPAITLAKSRGGSFYFNVAAVTELGLRPGMAVRLAWNASEQSVLFTFSDWDDDSSSLSGRRFKLSGYSHQGLVVVTAGFFRRFAIDMPASRGHYSYERLDPDTTGTNSVAVTLGDGRLD